MPWQEKHGVPSPGAGRRASATRRSSYVLRLLRGAGVVAATLAKLKELEAATSGVIGQIEEELGETNPTLRVLVSRLRVQDISIWLISMVSLL